MYYYIVMVLNKIYNKYSLVTIKILLILRYYFTLKNFFHFYVGKLFFYFIFFFFLNNYRIFKIIK